MKNPLLDFSQYLLSNLIELGIKYPIIVGTDSDMKVEFDITNLGVEFSGQTIRQIINDFLSEKYPNRFIRNNRMSRTPDIIVFDDLNSNEIFLQIILTRIIKEGKVWLAIRATY
ncbi:hypothetical protein COT76_01815, partial [Candidatus Berkelbacteria bacterium CG10_big_fil_rev_8_21_14_0_10_33_10]